MKQRMEEASDPAIGRGSREEYHPRRAWRASGCPKWPSSCGTCWQVGSAAHLPRVAGGAAAADCACVRLDSGPKAADGVQVSRIPEAWLARFGTPLPLKQLGFSKVAQLAHAVPHVVRVVTKVRNRRLLAQRSPCKVRSLCRPALRHAVFIRALRA